MVFQCDGRIVILARLSGGQDFLLQLVAARLGRERHGFPNLLQGQCIADAVRAEQQRVLRLEKKGHTGIVACYFFFSYVLRKGSRLRILKRFLHGERPVQCPQNQIVLKFLPGI